MSSRPSPIIWLLAALLAQALCSAALHAQTSPADTAVSESESSEHPGYHDIVSRAVAAFDAGRFAEARDLFSRAHALWPSARTLRALGMASFELKDYVRALEQLEGALVDTRRPISEEQRHEVAVLIDQVRPLIGRFRVRLSPADAALEVDGRSATLAADGTLLLEVGSHELVARTATATVRKPIAVYGREDRELAIEVEADANAAAAPAPAASANGETTGTASAGLASESARSGMPLWPWTLGGAAIAGGVALTTRLIGDSKAKCAPACSDGQASTIHTLDTITVVSAVVSGALIVATVVALLYPGDHPTDATPAVAVGVGPGFVSASGRF